MKYAIALSLLLFALPPQSALAQSSFSREAKKLLALPAIAANVVVVVVAVNLGHSAELQKAKTVECDSDCQKTATYLEKVSTLLWSFGLAESFRTLFSAVAFGCVVERLHSSGDPTRSFASQHPAYFAANLALSGFGVVLSSFNVVLSSSAHSSAKQVSSHLRSVTWGVLIPSAVALGTNVADFGISTECIAPAAVAVATASTWLYSQVELALRSLSHPSYRLLLDQP